MSDTTHDDTAAGDVPAVLTFRGGIPGFASAERFTLSDLTDDGTFQLLACVDDPEVSLVVTSPWLFFPDYAPELPDAELGPLGIDGPDELIVFCSVRADDTDELQLNLRAPFVTHARTRVARQLVLDDADLPLRATVPSGG